MKKAFEELHVWQNARTLSKELGKKFYDPNFRNYSFQDQIMRACISISNNIAEGNNRGSAKDFCKFLFIAKGSCAEVQSMLYLANDFGYITVEELEIYKIQTMTILGQLGKFIAYLRAQSL